jgi:hypothetical protein
MLEEAGGRVGDPDGDTDKLEGPFVALAVDRGDVAPFLILRVVECGDQPVEYVDQFLGCALDQIGIHDVDEVVTPDVTHEAPLALLARHDASDEPCADLDDFVAP